jgi:hypothetical protein
VTDDVQLPADSEWPSDESLDCRNSQWSVVTWGNAVIVSYDDMVHVYGEPDPRSLGIARAAARLCDGAEWRMGCAEYQP